MHALSEGLDKPINPFKSSNRPRMDGTASDRSERKERKFQNQQDDSPLLDEDQFLTDCNGNAIKENWVQKRRKKH